MKCAFFCLLLAFYTCQADLEVEKNEKEKENFHHNRPKITPAILKSEYSVTRQLETITYPLLEEIRALASNIRKAGQDPSDCIHRSTQFLLSSVDEFYIELDQCEAETTEPNNNQEISCKESLLSAFLSVANGAREYFKICIASIT